VIESVGETGWGVQDSETLGDLRRTTLSCGVLRIPTETASNRQSALRSTALRCWRPVLKKARAPIPLSVHSQVQPWSGSRKVMRSGFVRHFSASSPASTDGQRQRRQLGHGGGALVAGGAISAAAAEARRILRTVDVPWTL